MTIKRGNTFGQERLSLNSTNKLKPKQFKSRKSLSPIKRDRTEKLESMSTSESKDASLKVQRKESN